MKFLKMALKGTVIGIFHPVAWWDLFHGLSAALLIAIRIAVLVAMPISVPIIAFILMRYERHVFSRFESEDRQ